MENYERVSEYANRQRRATETLDFMRYCWARAKHKTFDNMWNELLQFGSARLDGILRKSSVAAGTAHGTGWATEVQDFQTLASEWLVHTSAKTVLGRLSYRRVPFQTRTIFTPAPEATFVGAGLGIPMSALDLSDSTTLKRTKVATIAVVTNELLELWRPGTRENLDAVLTLAVVRGIDKALLSEQAASAGVQPAGLLNGIAPIAALGSDVATVLGQVKNLLQALVDGGSDLDAAVFVMHPNEALTLSTMITTEGVRAFPALDATGGSILGIPAVTSVGAVRAGSPEERIFAVVDGAQIAVADDGEIEINTGRHADVQMVDASTQDATAGTGTITTSLFMTDSTGIKVLRTINWERLRDSAVAWLNVGA